MKKIVILDCGPSLKDVSETFGQSPEWIMKTINNKNCKFDWIKSYNGEKINSLEGDAWIITGSPRSVYQEEPWMLYLEKQIVKVAKKKYILGICFGHQLIAKSFGGKVIKNPKGWELGSYEIILTTNGSKSLLFKNLNNKFFVYESHQDAVIELPKNAVELAFNQKCNQSFQISNNIYAVQFHPEFSWDIIKKYVEIRSNLGVAVDDPRVLEAVSSYKILNNFVDLI